MTVPRHQKSALAGLRPKYPRRPQRGAALLIFMILVVTAALTYMVTNLTPEAVEARRMQQTSAALAQAREALIGYALTYREQQASQSPAVYDAVYGYLPLPDFGESFNRNSDFSHPCNTEGCAKMNATGLSGSDVLIGRLPWKTLGLQPLRDGHGECLWYAVAASHRGIDSSATVMNWDTTPSPDILIGSGQTDLSGIDLHNRPIAVIFSAGPAFSNDRTPHADATICGGNYDPAHYVNPDIGNRHPALAVTSEKLFSLLRRSSVETQSSAATRPPSFIDDINRMLDEMTECVRNESLVAGKISSACSDDIDARPPAGYYRHYRDQVFVAPCTNCEINGTERNECAGVLLFANQRGVGQVRHGTAVDDPANYLENHIIDPPQGNLDSYQNGAEIFNGPERLAPVKEQAVGQDIVRCIPKGGSLVELDNDFNDDGTPEFTNLARFSPGTRAITLGSTAPTTNATAASNLFGCLWTPEAKTVSGGFRSYFHFRIRKRGEGFTFAIVDGERNGSNVCGAAGQHLGYSWKNDLTFSIAPPKMGIEFDLSRQCNTPTFDDDDRPACVYTETGNLLQNGRNDPCYTTSCWRNSPLYPGTSQGLDNSTHVAAIYWGFGNSPFNDNVHDQLGIPMPVDSGSIPSPRNPAPVLPYPTTQPDPPHGIAPHDRMGGADGSKREFHARVELTRVPGDASADYTIKLWLEPHPAASINSITWETGAAVCANPSQRPSLRINASQHGFNAGNRMIVKDAVPNGYNGTYEVAERIDNNNFRVCLVDGKTNPGPYIRSIDWASNTAVVRSPNHGFQNGDTFTIDGAFPTQYNVSNVVVSLGRLNSDGDIVDTANYFRFPLVLTSDPGNLERAIVAAETPTPRAIRLSATDRPMSVLEPDFVPTIAHTATIRDEIVGACDINDACPSGQVCGADKQCYKPVFRKLRLGFTMGERQSSLTTARNQLIYLSDYITTWLP